MYAIYEVRLCAYFSQSERFWYGIYGVLVPIFHVLVRYLKIIPCEICLV